MKYSDFKKRAEEVCIREDEKNRLKEEFDLFKKRGWEKYICFLADVLPTTLIPYIGGSCLDSYALRKVIEPQKEMLGLLKDEKCHDILFGDALRLNYPVKGLFKEDVVRNLMELHTFLDDCVVGSKLFSKEVITSKENEKSILMIISALPIPDDDVELIANESKDSTPEEASRLMQYLIINITASQGI